MSNDTNGSVDINAQLAALLAENAKLKEKMTAKSTLSFKISDKGCLSVYGNGRFPTSLYAQQWLRLLERAEDIKVFIETNKSKLTFKE
jgi:hypothetical protein